MFGAKKTDATKVYASEEGPPAEEDAAMPPAEKEVAVKKSLAAKIYETLDKTVEKDKTLDGAREQHVPNSYLIPIWIIAKCVFVAALAGLTTTSFQADFTKKYLSPNYVFGDVGNYRLCNLIPASFSGSYLLDSEGYWQGTKSFQVGKAKYSVTLNDFSHTYKEYGEIMKSLKAAISKVAANAATSTVKENLLTWMSFAWVYVDDSVQHVMRFVGDPAVVLNRTYKQAALMNRYVPCGAEPNVAINIQGDVSVSYPIFAYGQAFSPTMSMKGCCNVGTVYTQIGNPKPKATQISTTWGVVATHTYTYSYTGSSPGSPPPPPSTVTVSTTSNVALSIVNAPASSASLPATNVVMTVGMEGSTLSGPSTLISTLKSTVTSSYKPYVLCFGPKYTGKTAGVANCATVSSINPVLAVTTTTTAASSPPTGSPTVSVASTTGIVAGMTVSGTGIAYGTTVSAIPTPSPTPSVALSVAATVASGATLTFYYPVVTTTVSTTGSSTALTVASATGIVIGMTVSGTGIASGTTVNGVSGLTVTLSAPANVASSTTLTFYYLGVTTTGTATITLGSETISVASITGIYAGMTVTGTDIPTGTTVVSVSGSTVTLSKKATAGGPGVSLTFTFNTAVFALPYITTIASAASNPPTGSPTLTVASTTGIVAGMAVSGTGIASGTTVTAIPSSTSLTISAAATISSPTTLTIAYPYDSKSSPRLIDASLMTTDDFEFVGYSPHQFEVRDGLFPALTEATEQFVTNYANYYPGYLDAASGGDMTQACVITPSQYGYNQAYDTAEFSINYNLRSLITAVAVNRGYLPLSALQEIFTALASQCTTLGFSKSSDGFCQLTYQGDTFQIHTYIDTKFDHMAPIFCLERQRDFNEKTDKFRDLCLLRVRSSFVYPFFDHMGTTSDTASSGPSDPAYFDPTYSCACADDTYSNDYLNLQPYTSGVVYTYQIRGSQKSKAYCNVLDLMHGFVMMDKFKKPINGGPEVSDPSGLYAVKRILQMAYANTATDLAKYAYVAGFMTLRLSYGTQILDEPHSNNGWSTLLSMYNEATTGKAGPFQFCNGYPASENSLNVLDSAGTAHGSPDCSIFAMNTFDNAEPALSNFHLNVLTPHCADEFSMPNSSWARNTTYRYNTTEVPTASNEPAGLGALYVPPQSLTQSYYICYNKWSTSLSLAFGSSAGTAGIAATVAISIMVSLISAGWFKKKGEGEGEGDGKKRGGISQGAVMMVGMLGTGAAIEASTKK